MYSWSFTLPHNKANCNCDCELAHKSHHTRKMSLHYLVKWRTNSSDGRYIVFLQTLVALERWFVLCGTSGCEKSWLCCVTTWMSSRISKVHWLQLTGEADKSISCSCKILQGFHIQKIIKNQLIFWESYSKNEKVVIFETQCRYGRVHSSVENDLCVEYRTLWQTELCLQWNSICV